MIRPMKRDSWLFSRRAICCGVKTGLMALVAATSVSLGRADAFVEITASDGVTSRFESIVAAFDELTSGSSMVVVGRHEVTPNYGGGNIPSNAPLLIRDKSNIVLRGLAGAEIFGAGPGDFLSIARCTNIVVEGIAFRGDHPPAGLIQDGLFSMIRLDDVNRDIAVIRCRFVDFGNHAISHLWGPKLSTSVMISGCHFENGGAMNVPGLGFDGAAVSGIGSNWKIVENTVINCVRGFELENSGSNIVQDVLIRGNTLVDIKDLGVMLFATNRDGEKFRRIVIRDNHFRDFQHLPGSATAIRLAGGSQITVSGNHVENISRQGLSFVSAQGSIQDLLIEGNTILRTGNSGIALWTSNHSIQRVAIRGNHIGLCGEAGIRARDVANLTISDNLCFNNGDSLAAAGIEIHGALSRHPMLVGNRCYDDREIKSQSYGIFLAPEVTYAMLRDNYCLDTEAVITGILDQSTRSDFAGNKVSLDSAGISGDLSVALVAAPTRASISLSEERRVRIVWPAAAEESFSVQFKNNLSESAWSNLADDIRSETGEASFEDTLEDASQRYYRVFRE
jgi:hypothetical protein